MNTILKTSTHKSIAAVLLATAILAAAILLWKNDAPAASVTPAAALEPGLVHLSSEQIASAGITLASAAPASLATIIQLPGEISYNEDRTAHIVPRLPGVAASVSAGLGQNVKQGQTLAVIASPELAELRSAALAASRRLDLARLNYQRETGLWQNKISAEQDYLQAQQAFREAEILSHSARSKLDAIGAVQHDGALNRHVLRAPFDGVIMEKHIATGEAVKEDANVFLLSDLSTVWADVAVTPANLDAVRVGQTALVKSSGTDAEASGTITYVGSLLGGETRSAKARVVISNPQRAWRPGLLVNVTIQGGQKDAPITVLADAVQTVEGKTVVYLKTAEGFLAQPVVTGNSDGKHVEIRQGLQAGAVYAAKGSFVIKAEQGKAGAEHGH